MKTCTRLKKPAIGIIAALMVCLVGMSFGSIDADAATSADTKARKAAATWAKNIAKDNSFTMGKGAKAHKAGCYYCKTNTKKKGKGWEKTYCANPFVQAAYAHGAKDSVILKDCKAGKAGPFTKSDFTKHMKFSIVKKPAKAKLLTGDVLGTGLQLYIYVGGGKVARTVEGNGADSIKIVNLSDGMYKGVKFVARYYK